MAIMTLPPSFMYVALPSPRLFLSTPIHMSLSISNQHAQILICLLFQSYESNFRFWVHALHDHRLSGRL
jgi:hypothetical protein